MNTTQTIEQPKTLEEKLDRAMGRVTRLMRSGNLNAVSTYNKRYEKLKNELVAIKKDKNAFEKLQKKQREMTTKEKELKRKILNEVASMNQWADVQEAETKPTP